MTRPVTIIKGEGAWIMCLPHPVAREAGSVCKGLEIEGVAP